MLYAAEQQRKISNPDSEEQPRHLAAAERKSRMDLLKAELTGFDLSDNLAPSNLSVDKLVDMQERGILRYIEWSEYTTREQELRNVKGILEAREWPFQKVRVSAHPHHRWFQQSEAEVFSLQRRGISLKLARLCSFTIHEQLINFLTQEHCRAPPTTFSAVTLEQVARQTGIVSSSWQGGLKGISM